MSNSFAPTVPAAVEALAHDTARGYTFQAADGSEVKLSFCEMAHQARVVEREHSSASGFAREIAWGSSSKTRASSCSRCSAR